MHSNRSTRRIEVVGAIAALAIAACGRSAVVENQPLDGGTGQAPILGPIRCAFEDVAPTPGFINTNRNDWRYVGRPEARGCAVYAPSVLIRTSAANPAEWVVIYALRLCNSCDDTRRLAWRLAIDDEVRPLSRDAIRLNDLPAADYGFVGDGPPITVAIRDSAGTTVPDACGWPLSPSCELATPNPSNHELQIRSGETALIFGVDSRKMRYDAAPIFFDWRSEWSADGGFSGPAYDYSSAQNLVFVVPRLQSVEAAPDWERPFENACASAGFPTDSSCGFVLADSERASAALELIEPDVSLPGPVLDAIRAHARQ